MNTVFCHSWSDSAMIFTCDFITCENHCQITSIGTNSSIQGNPYIISYILSDNKKKIFKECKYFMILQMVWLITENWYFCLNSKQFPDRPIYKLEALPCLILNSDWTTASRYIYRNIWDKGWKNQEETQLTKLVNWTQQVCLKCNILLSTFIR